MIDNNINVHITKHILLPRMGGMDMNPALANNGGHGIHRKQGVK
jgi:hypothetical protein